MGIEIWIGDAAKIKTKRVRKLSAHFKIPAGGVNPYQTQRSIP